MIAKKHEILSALLINTDPKEIADRLDVSYSYVLTLNKELQQAKLNNKLHELMDVDRAVIEHATANLDIDTQEIAKTIDKVDALSKLGLDLQATAAKINTQLRSHIMSTEHISDLAMCTEILCQLQSAFFGKNGVQINVQQNNNSGGTPRYDQFLSDAPGK